MTTNPPHTAWKALHVPEHLPALLRDAFAAQQAAFAKIATPACRSAAPTCAPCTACWSTTAPRCSMP